VNVLALDMATTTGWALREGGATTHGVQLFELKRGESPGMRYIRFRRWLEEIGARADIIVYENTVHSPGAIAREIATGFATRVHEYCATRDIDYTGVWPSTLKKWTTGKGNAKKPDMLAAAIRRGWVEPAADLDDNEVDAIALLHHALEEIVPTTSADRR
jgi:hypothetical protein